MFRTSVRNNVDDLYKDIIDETLGAGVDVTARGLNFREIRFKTFILTNPRARVIQNPSRKFSKRFCMGEFIWIMSGKDDLESVVPYNSRLAEFSDDGKTLHGAYGPRLRNWHGMDQIANTIKKLKADLYTRQASMVILDPSRDLLEYTKDPPCNNYLQFLYRDGKLDLMAYVRSNDLLLGFPYDLFHWTMLQEVIACELGVEIGSYYHMVGSMHIYTPDFEKMKKILNTPVIHTPMEPMPKNTALGTFEMLSYFEKEYRENNIKVNIPPEESLKYGNYWNDKITWLYKKETYRERVKDE